MENLEPRLLLAAVAWTGAGNGTSWSDANNWSTHALPTSADDVTIDLAGSNPTVALSSGAQSVHSLVSNEALQVSGGSLTVGTTAQLEQPLTLSSNGTLIGGAWSGSGGITASGGTLNGVTLEGAASVTGTVYVENGLQVNGTLTLNGTTSYGILSFDSTQTLGGEGTIVFASSTNSRIFLRGDGSPAALTIGSGLTINVQNDGEFWAYLSTDQVVNQATVHVDGGSTALTLVGRQINQGMLQMLNSGTVSVAGTLSLEGAGMFDSNGGLMNITGTLDNTGKTLALTGDTGSLTLQSWGRIKGGTITCSGGAGVTIDDGTFDGVTLGSDVYVQAGQWLNIYNGLSINAGVTFHVQTSNSSGAVDFVGTQSVTGLGQIAFDGSIGTGEARLIAKGAGTPGAITIGPGITVVATHDGDMGRNTESDSWINQGTIRADGGSVTLRLEGKDWVNQGRLEARNGATLELDGTFTTAGMGTFDGSDGTILIAGTLENAGSTLALSSTTGPLTVGSYYGTIHGGTITTAGGVQLYSADGTLDGVTLNGNATSTQIDFGTGMTIANGLVLNGTITVLSGGANNLTFEGTQTVSGNGQILLTGDGVPNLFTRDGSAPVTITIGPGITVHATDDSSVYAYTSTDYFVIQGPVQVDSGATLTLNPRVTLDLGTDSSLVVQGGSVLQIKSDLLGSTTNRSGFQVLGKLDFTGGTAGSPSHLEVMGRDLGATAAGFNGNFAAGAVELEMGTYVQLVDNADNSTGAEALYVNSLEVPTSATLDLNGLHLYARVTKVGGSIINGTVTLVPDGGALALNTSSMGSISSAGQTDEWTFYGRAGRVVTVSVNPGTDGTLPALSPVVGYVDVQLLDTQGSVLFSGSSSANGEVVGLSAVTLPADGTYTLRIQAAATHSGNTGSYTVAVWDVTPTVGKLALNQDTNGRIDTPLSVNRWTFTAAAGELVRLQLLNTGNPDLAFRLTGPNDWTGLNDQIGSSDLVTLPFSGVYTLTAYSTSSAYNIPFAFRLQETAQTDLALGVPYSGTFAGNGQAQLFRIQVPSSAPLRLVLDDGSAQDHTELYLSFGQPPTRAQFGYSSAAGADQQITVPLAAAGTWYALVYSAYVQRGGGYTLTATSSPVLLTGVTPARVSDSAPATLTLAGSGFDATSTVQLVSGGNTIAASSVSHDTFTQITATFPGGIPAGAYQVRVTRADSATAVLDGALTVVAGGHAELDTSIILSSQLHYHGLDTIYVEYTNTGDVAMSAPLLVLRATQNGSEGAFLTLDQSRLTTGFWTSAMPDGFSHSIKFLASGEAPGLLLPGESCRVPIYWAGWQQPWDMDYAPFSFTLTAVYADDTASMDWGSMQESLRPASVSTEAWTSIYGNLTGSIPTWGAYVAMLDENAAYLGRLGERVVDVTQLWNFELQQNNGFGFLPPLATTTDASVDSPGVELSFQRSFASSITGRTALGRLGRGWYDNWDYSLQTFADGTVIVHSPGGGSRTFQPDVRGGFLAGIGDYGTLEAGPGGTYTLREADGLVRVYRSDGHLDYVGDAAGTRITCGYTAGLLTSLTHSSGEALTITYNAAGRINSITDGHGRTASYTYDASGEHLISVQGFDGRTTGYDYQSAAGTPQTHALLSINLPDGASRVFAYDQQGRLTASSLSGTLEAETYAYDAPGAISLTDAAGGTRSIYFGADGLPVKYVDALGQGVMLSYDRNGNLTGIMDPAGRSYTARYDSMGNILAMTDPKGATTQFTYTTTLSRLSGVIDANGNLTHYSYDARGNLVAASYADGSSDAWGYDAAGLLTEQTNGRGHTTAYTYDAAGRILSITRADASHVDYTYDAHGNLLSMTDATGLTSYTYDSHDDLTRIDYPGGAYLVFTYDAAGRRSSRTDQSGRAVNSFYDAAGRLQSLTDESDAELVHYSYDSAGRLARADFGNGIYAMYEYDLAGQLLHLVNHLADDSVLSRFDYTYDSRGRRTAMGTISGLWRYEYDDLGQLVHAVFAPGDAGVASQDLVYAYDAMGNRTQTIINGITTTYAANAMNQYTVVGDTQYAYDADGNLVSSTGPGGTTQYAYDDDNRLVSVASNDGTWQYAYNGIGQRISSTLDGVTTTYVVDPAGLGNVAGAYTGAGSLLATYDYGLGLVSSVDAGASRSYYDVDGIGSVVDITSAAGAVQNQYAYLPFGGLLAGSGAAGNPLQFVGALGVTAESDGLLSMRQRFYDASTGRFLSVDPLYTAGANTYAYVSNEPTSFIDPAGLRGSFGGNSYGDDDGDSDSSGSSNDSGGTYHGRKWNDFGSNNSSNSDSNASKDDGPSFWSSPWQWFKYHFDLSGGNSTPDPNQSGGKGASTRSASSTDPNEKRGPGGYGSQGYLQPGMLMPYRVDFENDPWATAPAQYVTIDDSLSTNLDWSTFTFTQFGFGDQVIGVNQNAQHFETTTSMTFDGRTFDVQIKADLDLDTGSVRVQFISIDPATSLPPTGAVGFLPPEDGSGRGMGYFCFNINAKDDLSTGTEIRNIAQIQFDLGETIATDQVDPHDPTQGVDAAKQCLNTIDAGAPASSVSALPQSSAGNNFAVVWSGSDDAAGSGIALYDVYVSDDGGAWTAWLTGTAETSAMFSGTTGHQYAFYSVATDAVGNVEAAPATADASTTIAAATLAAYIKGPAGAVRGETLTYIVAAPDSTDAAGVTYAVDFGDGTPVQQIAPTPGNASSATITHIFTGEGSFNVTVTATDAQSSSGVAGTQHVGVAIARLAADPANRRRSALFVGGSSASDAIVLKALPKNKISLLIGGKSKGAFAPTGRIIVFGQAGNDAITVQSAIKVPAWLFGGAGNDRITAGAGGSVLLGEAGKDLLAGGAARDILIGGSSADKLVGNGGDDVLIGGWTDYDASYASLFALQKEWLRTNASYSQRVLHLRGAAGGLNSGRRLVAATVHDDAAGDILTGGAGTDAFWGRFNRAVKDKADRRAPEVLANT